MESARNRLVWLDLEMTGLDLEQDVIIEIATVVTSSKLEIVAEGPCMALHCDNEKLEKMDEWNSKQHKSSGLIKRVRSSTIKAKEAQDKTLEFLERYVDRHASPMCGNTICTDRQFLNRHMPDLANFFHYRNLDVSSFKEVFKRWFTHTAGFKKHSSHLALSDVYNSIEELQFYRTHFIKSDPKVPSNDSYY